MKIKNTDTVLIVSKDNELSFYLPKQKEEEIVSDGTLTFVAMFALLQERDPKFIKLIEKKIAELQKEGE